jgi:hypothetical protein
MSLVIVALQKNFAVVVSDGKSLRIENGRRVPHREDRCKFTTLADNIVLASTG